MERVYEPLTLYTLATQDPRAVVYRFNHATFADLLHVACAIENEEWLFRDHSQVWYGQCGIYIGGGRYGRCSYCRGRLVRAPNPVSYLTHPKMGVKP